MISIPLEDLNIPTTYSEWSEWWNNLFDQTKKKFPTSSEMNLTFDTPDTSEERAATNIAVDAAWDAAHKHNLGLVIKYR
ncbi:hypothetical protein KA005_86065 [bacterium]|nr:hypothetical protein [bacterium]